MECSRTKLSEGALIAQAHTHYKQGLVSSAELLADLAEIEARRIHIAMGYRSVRAWCIGELKMSDDAIQDRIQAARTAREYPTIFSMLADGRLHLTAVLMLSPYLTAGNAVELLAGAAGKTKSELAEWLAARFPRSESFGMVTPEMVGECADSSVPERMLSSAFVRPSVHSSVPERMNRHIARGAITPVAAGRHRFEFMGSDAERDLAREVQDLRGSNDLAAVVFEALALLKAKLEKRKCGRTERPRRAPRPLLSAGHRVSAAVRNEVWKRDGGQCAFIGEKGHRCEARRGLEYDHVVPVARGGESTASNVRLLCRVHNQFEAERVFGRDFMEGKREEARERSDTRARLEARTQNEATQHELEGDVCLLAEPQDHGEEQEQLLDVIAALKGLGVQVERTRWAAEAARNPGATLEEHIRAALKLLRPRRAVVTSG